MLAQSRPSLAPRAWLVGVIAMLAVLSSLGYPDRAVATSGQILWNYSLSPAGPADTISDAVRGPGRSAYAVGSFGSDADGHNGDLAVYRFSEESGTSVPVAWKTVWPDPSGMLTESGAKITTDAGGDPIVACTQTQAGSRRWLIIKYTPTGAVSWATAFEGGHDAIGEVACDHRGNVIVCGMDHANGSSDLIVSKFRASDGVLRWTYRRSSSLMADQQAYSVSDLVVDSADDVVVVGSSQDSQGNPTHTVLVGLTARGKPEWTRSFTGSDSRQPLFTQIALDGRALYAAGAITYGNLDQWHLRTVIARYTLHGRRVWLRRGAGPVDSVLRIQLAIDGAGNPIIGGALTTGSPHYRKLLVESRSPDGGARWTTIYGPSTYPGPAYAVDSLVADAPGGVYAAGIAGGPWYQEAMVMRLSPAGRINWMHTLGSSGWASSVVLMGRASLLVTGKAYVGSGTEYSIDPFAACVQR